MVYTKVGKLTDQLKKWDAQIYMGNPGFMGMT
jgi:hypothetical protein